MKYKRKTRVLPWKPIFISFAVLIGLFIISIYIILFNYDLTDLKPHISKLVEHATGRKLIIYGNIHLQVSLAPRVIIEDIALTNAPWGSNQNMIQAKRLKLQVALLPLLSNKIIIKQLVISEPHILLEIGHHGKTNFDFETSSAFAAEKEKIKRNMPIFGSKRIIIENGQFTYNDLRKNESYVAKIKRVYVSGKDINKPVNLKFYGLYNEQAIKGEGTLGPLPALSDASKKFQVNILVKSGGNFLSLNGGIQDFISMKGVAFRFDSTINNPSIIEKFTKQPIPIKAPFKLSGEFAASDALIYQIPGFNFSTYGIHLDGFLVAAFDQERPTIKGVINAKKLNLRPLIPSTYMVSQKKTPVKTKQKESRVFPLESLPVIDLNTVDADFKIHANSVLLPDITVRNLSANVHIKEDHLHIDDFKAEMSTGTLDGYFHFNQDKNVRRVDTVMKVEHMPIDVLVPAKRVAGSLEGDVDMLFSLTGHGNTIAEIMGNLNGDFGLSMCNGKIATKYIDLLGVEFSTGLVKMLNPFKRRTDHTEVNCFVCILEIHKGIAQTKALVLDTGRTLTIGKGYVDFKTEKLNISLKPVPTEGIGIEKIGKISISLSEFYKPVKISGTLAKPALAIDLTQTAITLSKVAGGVALLGPAGVALALITGRIGDDNYCLSAVEAVRKGSKEKGLKYDKKEGILEKTTNSITDRIKKLLGSVFKRGENISPA